MGILWRTALIDFSWGDHPSLGQLTKGQMTKRKPDNESQYHPSVVVQPSPVNLDVRGSTARTPRSEQSLKARKPVRKLFMFNPALPEATTTGSYITSRKESCLWPRFSKPGSTGRSKKMASSKRQSTLRAARNAGL